MGKKLKYFEKSKNQNEKKINKLRDHNITMRDMLKRLLESNENYKDIEPTEDARFMFCEAYHHLYPSISELKYIQKDMYTEAKNLSQSLDNASKFQPVSSTKKIKLDLKKLKKTQKKLNVIINDTYKYLDYYFKQLDKKRIKTNNNYVGEIPPKNWKSSKSSKNIRDMILCIDDYNKQNWDLISRIRKTTAPVSISSNMNDIQHLIRTPKDKWNISINNQNGRTLNVFNDNIREIRNTYLANKTPNLSKNFVIPHVQRDLVATSLTQNGKIYDYTNEECENVKYENNELNTYREQLSNCPPNMVESLALNNIDFESITVSHPNLHDINYIERENSAKSQLRVVENTEQESAPTPSTTSSISH